MEDEFKYTLGWTTTNFKPSPKQVAIRENFQWVITDEDPKQASKSHYRTTDDIVNQLPTEGLRSEQWLDLCREHFEITEDAFQTLRVKAKNEGRIHYVRSDGDKWKPSVSELKKRQESLFDSQDGNIWP